LYVRCQDANGNSNVQEYVVEFCVEPADDIAPPVITEFVPEVGYVGFEVTEKIVQFYTNEPADCKWDLVDQDYETMEGPVICSNEIDDITLKGWLCSTTLPVVGEEENTDYYFRCADQPWLEDDDDGTINNDRNINTEGIIYTLIKTTEELIISSVNPNNETIINGTGDGFISVDLVLQTEGGADGSAFCEFSFGGDDGIFIDFFESGGTTHKQTFNTLFEGDYDISLMCTDVAENVATGSSEFSIELDGEGPIITRAYEQGGSLTIITNEDSTCAYDFDSCGFNFDEGELMNGNGLIHTTPFEAGFTYHIKCQDGFGNTGGCLQVTEGY